MLFVLRIAYFLFGTRDEFWYFALGHHFDAFGDAKRWSLINALGSSQRVLVYVVVSRFSKSYPDCTQVVGQPMRKLMLQRQKWTSLLTVLQIAKWVVQSITLIEFAVDVAAIFVVYPNLKILALCYQLLWSVFYPFTGYHYVLTLIHIAIFLTITCIDLGDNFAFLEMKLKSLGEVEFIFPTIETFERTCAKLSKLDFFWKRVLFVVVTVNTLIYCNVLQLSVFTTLPPPVAVAVNVAIVNCLLTFSYILLAPAYVNAQARKCYPRFCSKMFDANCTTRYLRFKLCHTLKRFSRPIAFTLWDTNALDYMDYVNVSCSLLSVITKGTCIIYFSQCMFTIAANFLLLTKLMIKNTVADQ